MDIVFYRTLLTRAKNITPSEKIIYSFLVAKSIERLEDVWDVNGKELCTETLMDYINEGCNHIDLVYINHSTLAKQLYMTRPTIINGLKNLQNKGYLNIYQKLIYVNEDLLKHGFFKLQNAKFLCGDLLIFYSFLVEKSKKYENTIDTYKSKLAMALDKSDVAITKMLNRLYKLKLVERLPDGKLLIK